MSDAFQSKKQWRAHMARVRALPREYEIVYREIQKYFFKLGAVGQLPGLLEFFEQGAAEGTGVRELLGDDVVAFADGLVGA